jgi:predicted homoserine dehydrogenase-like protein
VRRAAAVAKVKIGIIGAGGIANNHAHYYRDIPDVELVAVADVVEERAMSFAQRWGIPPDGVFTDYVKMLDSVEARRARARREADGLLGRPSAGDAQGSAGFGEDPHGRLPDEVVARA